MKNLTLITLIALTLIAAKGQSAHTGTGANGEPHSANEYSKQNERMNNLSQKPNMVIYPNPAIKNLSVEVNSTMVTRATFKVINLIGKNIVTETIDLKEGITNMSVDISELQSGIYFIKVEDGQTINLSQKFTKQ